MKQSQNQNNKRGRGRGRRQSQNPLSRNYESNGPDVKIRGTTAHISEKYLSLARDALSSGDRVSAENYFQHAEHYMRLIANAKDQQKTSENADSHASNSDEQGEDTPKAKKKPKRKNHDKASKGNGVEDVAFIQSSPRESSQDQTEENVAAVSDETTVSETTQVSEADQGEADTAGAVA